jgi:histidinol-phosphate aminotransferase
MKPTPNSGISDIAPYVGGKSTAKPGVKVIKLSSNETPLGASPEAIAAYLEAAKTLHRYPDGSAQKLREAIGEVYSLPAEQIICGAGSDELIGLLVHAYVSAGDEVLISQHGFLMYKIYAQSVGAKVVAAPEKDMKTDVDAHYRRIRN